MNKKLKGNFTDILSPSELRFYESHHGSRETLSPNLISIWDAIAAKYELFKREMKFIDSLTFDISTGMGTPPATTKRILYESWVWAQNL